MASSFDVQERAYYDRLFSIVDKDDSGVLPGQDALPFLVSSGLSQVLLGEVWALADPDNNGFLTRDAWYKAARLIGWLQKGGKTSVDESLTTQRGPYPSFAGQTAPPTQAASAPSMPAITPADRTKFTRLFVGCSPSNGLVSGDRARDAFVKSKLDYEKLGQIWNLADTQQRGSLDLTDFIIGMFLIQSCMANPSLSLPASLPPGMYEQASGGRPAPLTPQRTGSSIRPQHTGPMSPQRTGTPRSAAAWDVTPEAKAASDRFFAELDKQNRGMIDGDVAVPFMLQSQLDEGTLATIWDLADMKHEGRLDRDQFAVAMHLINSKLAGGQIPPTLPQSLIPPTLRGTLGQQEVLSGPSNAAKDLFDLFDDTPISPVKSPASPQPSTFLPPPPSRRDTRDTTRSPPPPTRSSFQPTVSAPPQPAPVLPASDLLGDESSTIVDNSAELGNKRNELASTSRSIEQLGHERQALETKTADSQAQLADLEAKLSEAKSKHETETRAVADLRARCSEQSKQLRTYEADVISAESDVSALKSEKAELEQALLRDKEEIRGLQRMMKDVQEEKTSLVNVLEKLRKESRQQKGMVTIAKKQLATAESSRDAVQKEVDGEAGAAAAVPLPVTPQALSPVATGMSQRSNNPFDRLARAGSSGTSTSPPSSTATGAALLGAGAGAAAGLVVAGAETLFHAAKEVVSPSGADEAGQVAGQGETGNSLDGQELSSRDDRVEVTPKPDGSTALPQVADKAESIKQTPDPQQTTPSGAESTSEPGIRTASFNDSAADPDTDQPDVRAPTLSPVTASAPLDGAKDSPQMASAMAPGDANIDHDGNNDRDDPFGTETPLDSDPFGMTAPDRLKDNVDNKGAAGFDDAFGQSSPAPLQSTLHDRAVPSTSADDFDAAFADLGENKVEHERAEHGLDETHESIATRDNASSDEDEGPEDIEAPSRYQSPPPGGAVAATGPLRRSAPPPPARNATAALTEDFDPFGASSSPPAQTAGPASAAAPSPTAQLATPLPNNLTAPKGTNFDDDDFDFSDLPPAKVDQAASPASQPIHQSGFDDEFAGFDDEFGPSQPPSDGSVSKSYEMVSPTARDEWGHSSAPAGQPAPMSFDDAFGGDFEPASSSEQGAQLAAPPLPQRQNSTAQSDDIEDVKKLCAMGFSRTLVIAALDANAYDFQKALNVLLAQ